jgi:hypothetical protein
MVVLGENMSKGSSPCPHDIDKINEKKEKQNG